MDELQISGKRFISSRRLARDHGYTADYLGQLIRGGKVAGQKVGRAWYVDAASFDTYLGGETPITPVVPVAVEVLKPEIPEQRSSNLLVRQSSQDAGEARPFAQEFPAPPTEAEKIKKEEEPVYHVPLHIIKKEETNIGGLRYFSDDEPSLPEIRSIRKESRVAEPLMPAATAGSPVFVPANVRQRSKLPFIALAGAGLMIFIFSALVSSIVSLNLSIEGGNTASTFYSLP